MKELVDLSLNRANILGASYADIRIIDTKREQVLVKNGKVEAIATSKAQGFGVRVLAEGAWGFAASYKIKPREIEAVTTLAFKIAKASALVKKTKINLASCPTYQETYVTPFLTDPFAIPLEKKLELLFSAEEIIRKTKGISISQVSLDFFQKNQVFASTEGSYIKQKITTSGGGIFAKAIKGQEMQERSYPNSAGGQFVTGGFEFIEALKLKENAARVAEEAVALLSAKECPSTTTTVILDSSQVSLQIHESLGHPAELDRVLGMEESFAGGSFLTLDKLGGYRFGSEIVSIYADATFPGGLGTFGYDDEGAKAQKVKLVERGKLVGYLTSRETAPVLGKESNGAMRADGWNRIPLIRMTNINLEPGRKSFEEIISETKEGLYLETNKSWSIDDKRLNFQFAVEAAREIKKGKLGTLIKNPNYTGITPYFWKSCDAIANEKSWKMWGLPNCGKGEPIQTMAVGHGASPARFRNVKVGVGK